MTKELEAIKYLDQFINEMTECLKNPKQYAKDYDKQIFYKYEYTFETVIKQALQRLEAIDNANPSEALECLEKLKGIEISAMPFKDDCGTKEVDLNDIRKVGSQLNTDFREYTDTIKQALLKAQEQEKVLKVIFEKNVDIKLLKWCINNPKKLTTPLLNYNINMNENEELTEEEFDLLKRCCK